MKQSKRKDTLANPTFSYSSRIVREAFRLQHDLTSKAKMLKNVANGQRDTDKNRKALGKRKQRPSFSV